MRNIAGPTVEPTVTEAAGTIAYRDLNGVSYTVKGLIDRAVAALALLLLGPLVVAVAIAVRWSSPGPVLVRQTRVGRFGKPFTFYKFRSMREDAELMRDGLEDGNDHETPAIFKMRRDPRVTRFGAFIRRTSIDELPNLFNVLRGDMSLVGPRPPLPREVMHYSERDMQRLAATPGITGLWQVRGRSEIPFSQMVAIDLEYIDNWSLWLDVKILLRTPFAVIGGRGAW